MKYDSEKHRRQSIRLKDYDYSQAGAYFITICSNNKRCLLGSVLDSKIELSSIGKIATQFWLEIPEHFKEVQLDEFIVMPNHIHGIITITDKCRGVKFNAPTKIS